MMTTEEQMIKLFKNVYEYVSLDIRVELGGADWEMTEPYIVVSKDGCTCWTVSRGELLLDYITKEIE